ncbi:tRNA (adenosine(37)-N6)-threonylcarbamoyltransferase complex ATPase subunit type 1 TsaE [Candidatus Saccharibacteria bacterium]|nr:tRNA (adenosine(37)-N6)-threonylcarbamoyltransferase complex ATPase subunit type 1 TsaE [Candidatus Saccharibacteria bacterium]
MKQLIAKQLESLNQEQTINIAKSIGFKLQGGECIELIGDIGSGKTTFVRGLAKGAGSSDHISSPTFTISKIYETPNFKIAHFDFYRLHEAGMIDHEIEEAVHDKETVIVVEWSDIVQHVLPKERLTINISSTAENKRFMKFQTPENLSYLLESL